MFTISETCKRIPTLREEIFAEFNHELADFKDFAIKNFKARFKKVCTAFRFQYYHLTNESISTNLVLLENV